MSNTEKPQDVAEIRKLLILFGTVYAAASHNLMMEPTIRGPETEAEKKYKHQMDGALAQATAAIEALIAEREVALLEKLCYYDDGSEVPTELLGQCVKDHLSQLRNPQGGQNE